MKVINTNDIDQIKQNICLDFNITTNNGRIIKKALKKEFLYDINSLTACDYLLRVSFPDLNQINKNHSAITGQTMTQVQITTDIALFKINKGKIKELHDILHNPVAFESPDIKGKFHGIGTAMHATIKENMENFEEYNAMFIDTNNKILAHHKMIYTDSIMESTAYIMSPNLFTSQYYSKIYQEEHLAKVVGEKIVNKVILFMIQKDKKLDW